MPYRRPSLAVVETDPSLHAALSALEDGRLRLALQPVVRAGSGLVAFREGLARIADAQGRLLPAHRFVPALERARLAPRLDRAALSLGLAALRNDPALRLAINVSGGTVGDAGWLDALRDAARTTPDAARRLIVELTESAPVAPAEAHAFRCAVGRLGPAFAVDDFGAGLATVERVRMLRPDVLKLDASLADGSDADLRRAVTLGAAMEALVVAEGVTTPAQERRLIALGVDAVQGSAVGEPELLAA